MPSAISLSPQPKGPQLPVVDVVGLWLTSLMRASSELLEAYVIGGRAQRGDVAPPAVLVESILLGSTRGQLRCLIDGPLALAVAEGMWGEPAASLRAEQVNDAARELCGQIIGYAAGEVSARFPGVLFEPPRSGDKNIASPDDRAVVPTRVGALRWEVRAEAASDPLAPHHHAVTVRDRIRALRDSDLPLLQAVRVLGVDETATDAFERLVRAVGTDPVLSARILRRVNSAMVKPRGSRIQTLPQAVLFLGTRSAKNIVISAFLSHSTGSSYTPRRRIVRHSLQVAILSRQLGLTIGLDGDECYLLGLLHDFGRLVLDRLYPEEALALEVLEEEELLDAELKSIGITHVEAGTMVASAWRFPDSVRLVMAAHHDGSVIDQLGLPDEQAQQVRLVSVADRLAECWEARGLTAVEPACQEAAAVLMRSQTVIFQCLERASEQFTRRRPLAIPSNLRAIVADDSDVTRFQVGQILDKLGVQVVAYAEDGVQAVQRSLQLSPDLLISDLVMPRLTGVDVVRLVKTRLPTKIIIITSHCDKSMHTRCLAMGASEVLIKPVTAEDLQQVLVPLWDPDYASNLRARTT